MSVDRESPATARTGTLSASQGSSRARHESEPQRPSAALCEPRLLLPDEACAELRPFAPPRIRMIPPILARHAPRWGLTVVRTLGGHRRYVEAEVFALAQRWQLARERHAERTGAGVR